MANMLYFVMIPTGPQIYFRRLAGGFTQDELARKAGIPQSNLSNIEKGKRDLTLTTLRKIAYGLGIPIREFFESELESKETNLTRPRMEKIAKAIAGVPSSLNQEDQRIVELFREILPKKKSRGVSLKKMYASWLALKRRFSSSEINAIYQRVEEMMKRSL